MADGGQGALQPPPAAPTLPAAPHAHPAQLAAPPAQPAAPPVQPGPVLQLNWSHFKLEFARKTDEDAEAHLPR